MSQSIICVYCSKPLLDVAHAKEHVKEKCEKSPHGELRKERDDALGRARESDKLAVERNALEVSAAMKDQRISELERERAQQVQRGDAFKEEVRILNAELRLMLARAEKTEGENTRLIELLRRAYVEHVAASHEPACAGWYTEPDPAAPKLTLRRMNSSKCSCWLAEAFTAITAAPGATSDNASNRNAGGQ